ncbi:protein FAM210B, mitochondrial [Hoplias malabaricus]|uniref:protein FAM210B, mitochondrial n=1 Tax=Hoplias malabaricus TaxID=27720 RepID=UPI003461C1D7
MFLSRGARSTGSLACRFHYNVARTAEVGTNVQQDVAWWDRIQRLCYARVYERNSRAVCQANEAQKNNFVKGTGCKFSLNPEQVSRAQWTSLFTLQSKSMSTPEFIFRFPWMSKERKINRLFATEYVCPTEMCTPHFSLVLSRAFSSASNQEQSKRNPAAEVVKDQQNKGPLDEGEEQDPEPEKKQNKRTQLKKVFKEYGAVGVSFHVGISLISLGIFYLAVSSGIDMAAVLYKMGFSESVVQSKMAAGTSTFVLAYAVHKLFAPVRISITLVSVPFIVRYLRKTGLFKAPPPSL